MLISQPRLSHDFEPGLQGSKRWIQKKQLTIADAHAKSLNNTNRYGTVWVYRVLSTLLFIDFQNLLVLNIWMFIWTAKFHSFLADKSINLTSAWACIIVFAYLYAWLRHRLGYLQADHELSTRFAFFLLYSLSVSKCCHSCTLYSTRLKVSSILSSVFSARHGRNSIG